MWQEYEDWSILSDMWSVCVKPNVISMDNRVTEIK